MRMLGPVVVVAVLSGCAGAEPAPDTAPGPAPLVAGPTGPAGPVPLPVPVEPSAAGGPKPLPIDGAPLDPGTVPGCDGGCEVRFDIALPDGGRFAGVQGPGGSPGALLVRRTADGGVRTAGPGPDASVTDGVCDAQRCVVVVGVGGRGVGAVVVDVDDLAVTGRAGGGAPGARPVDLDGDDRVDLALPRSAGGPARADAPTLWSTWRQTADGALRPTGCGPLTDADRPPSELQTAPCPPG